MPEKSSKRHYLYLITCHLNGKLYVGQALNPKGRWSGHKTFAKTGAVQAIDRAIAKYGVENFTIDTIVSGILTCSCCPGKKGLCRKEIDNLEEKLIIQYDCLAKDGKGYNVRPGGDTTPHDDYTIQKIKTICAKRTNEEKDEISRKLSIALKGRHLSPQSEFKKGHQHSPETLAKIAATKLANKVLSTNQPKPLRKPRFISPEMKQHLSEVLSTISWVDDQTLLQMVNEHNITKAAEILKVSPVSISRRLLKRGLVPIISQANSTSFSSGAQHKMAKLN